jgi:hypothetical protein
MFTVGIAKFYLNAFHPIAQPVAVPTKLPINALHVKHHPSGTAFKSRSPSLAFKRSHSHVCLGGSVLASTKDSPLK